MQDAGNYSKSVGGLMQGVKRAWGIEREIRKLQWARAWKTAFIWAIVSAHGISWKQNRLRSHSCEQQQWALTFTQTKQQCGSRSILMQNACGRCVQGETHSGIKNMLRGNYCSVHQQTTTTMAHENTDPVRSCIYWAGMKWGGTGGQSRWKMYIWEWS